jgi:hypothetical protein
VLSCAWLTDYLILLIFARIAIDGFYLKEFLTKKKDVSRDMAVSMIRMMRKHEAMKSDNPEDDCHFVDHNWAVSTIPPQIQPTLTHFSPFGRIKLMCQFSIFVIQERVLQDGASTAECFKLFTQPELLTPLEMCKRVGNRRVSTLCRSNQLCMT